MGGRRLAQRVNSCLVYILKQKSCLSVCNRNSSQGFEAGVVIFGGKDRCRRGKCSSKIRIGSVRFDGVILSAIFRYNKQTKKFNYNAFHC